MGKLKFILFSAFNATSGHKPIRKCASVQSYASETGRRGWDFSVKVDGSPSCHVAGSEDNNVQ